MAVDFIDVETAKNDRNMDRSTGRRNSEIYVSSRRSRKIADITCHGIGVFFLTM